MYRFKIPVYTALVLAITACASVDRGMMAVSDTVSSRDPVTGQRQINLVSEEKEINRAEAQTQQLLTKAKKEGVEVDGTHYEQVSRVFKRLVVVAHRKHLPWEVHVLGIDEFQAFTIGGGKVFVFTGLFQPSIGVKNDDELAAVLGHEIAHVTARHASEAEGKLTITKMTSKKLRNDSYAAAFTTMQEDEADRYSVIYSALAGYDPKAGIAIWTRLNNTLGSYTGDMLYDHPLNDDRARNLQSYAALAEQYYTPGTKNPQHETLLKNNTVFSYNEIHGPAAGEGGGFVALLETAANTYSEVLKAQNEQAKRQIKQMKQERQAAQRLLFQGLKISPTQNGGQGLFGTAVNAANDQIKLATVVVEYLNGQVVIYQEQMQWPTMVVHERRQFGVPLQPIQYTSVSIRPVYVQLVEE